MPSAKSKADVPAKRAANPKRETSLHWHTVHLLENFLPCPPCWFTTFPAGGGGERRGMMLKNLCLKAGVPDVLIIYGADPLPPAIRQLVIEAINHPDYIGSPLALAAGDEMSRMVLSPAAHWIELKRAGTGKLSDAQIETQGFLAACGCKIANCENLDQVKAALDAWRMPRYVEKPSAFQTRVGTEKALANLNGGDEKNAPFNFATLENLSDLR